MFVLLKRSMPAFMANIDLMPAVPCLYVYGQLSLPRFLANGLHCSSHYTFGVWMLLGHSNPDGTFPALIFEISTRTGGPLPLFIAMNIIDFS